jgi:ADP-heptose:LPS heptosyltransferase
MGLSKTIELVFRRALLRMLRFAARRRPATVRTDYNHCKFLFIRQDRIGDVLVSTPLLISLKRNYPGAVIDVLLSSNNHFVLNNETAVRKRWVYDKKFFSSLRVLFGIRSERYDFVIDLMDNPSATSTVILLLAGGKWNVGLEKDNSYAYDIVVPMLSRKETHIVDRLAQLLKVFGIEIGKEDLSIHYQTSASSEEAVRAFIAQRTPKGKHLIGINISAGNDSRFWGIPQYRLLMKEIRTKYSDAKTILLYKPSDSPRAEEIASGFPGVFLAPEMTFDEFAAMIRHLWLLITPDTSAVHLAAAFHIPSVVLYVQADSTLRIWEPYNTDCEPVITTSDTLAGLEVPRVVEAIRRITGRIRPGPSKIQRRPEHA